MEKPDFGKIRTSVSTVSLQEKRLASLSEDAEKAIKRARGAYDEAQEAAAERELKEMPVERLADAKNGIRVTYLKEAGYRTIWQLRGVSVSTLTRVKGVGEKTARKIKKAVDVLVESTKSNAAVRLSTEQQTAKTDRVVKSLYEVQKLRALADEAKTLELQSDEINKLTKQARPATSPILWAFASEEKRALAVEAATDLAYYETGAYAKEAAELTSAAKEVSKTTRDAYWKDFEQNAASYYATLDGVRFGTLEQAEKVAGAAATDANANAQAIAIQNGLSSELAVAIGALPLDLRGLKCTLRTYQFFGVQYVLNQGAVLLGDEMGLGKTVEAIAAMVAIRNAGATHFVVVCPASVLVNWCRELQKHSDLVPYQIHGADSTAVAERWLAEGGVAVTNYENVGKITLPDDFRYGMLVVDEAHYVKNPAAQRTKGVMALREKTDRVLFMTGTPLENRVSEMQFLISCLQPSVSREISQSSELALAKDFRRKISTVYLRRTREDVLTELPEKIENETWCALGSVEEKEYEAAVCAQDFMGMRQLSWKNVDVADSCKAAALKNLVAEAAAEGRKILVFSFFLNTIAKTQELLGGGVDIDGDGTSDVAVFGPISGSVPPEERQKLIDEFSAHEGAAVLLAQIQAGGTGVNIQAASVVIICEPQIKPSIENQAISRVYRMGQTRSVMVYRLLCENTVDERVLELLRNKQQIFDNFAEESESGAETLKLGDDDMKRIMEEELKRIQALEAAEVKE